MADYLPGPDADFENWVNNFVTYANANLAALGLVAGDLAPITAGQTSFTTNLTAHVAAAAAARAARQSKTDSRAVLTTSIRSLVRRLQASPLVNDAERSSLGITVRQENTPIGPPTTFPLVSVECGNRLEHTIRFVDAETPSRRAKPKGVSGVEIWNKLGTPPANESELHFVAVDTRAPYTITYDIADGGKTAYYWLRWVSPTGERGPWSVPGAATIAA